MTPLTDLLTRLEGAREEIARKVGSYVVYDDRGGPDTETLHDVIGGDYEEATRRVYELTDSIIALLRSLLEGEAGAA